MCSPLKGFLLIVLLKATRDKCRFRFDSMVCNLSPQCAEHRRDDLHGMLHTAEMISTVCGTPWRFFRNLEPLTPQYVAHRRDRLRGGMHAAGIFFEIWNPWLHGVQIPRRSSLGCIAHRGDNFVIEYLNEIETELENTLACLSGAQMSSNHENLLTHSL